MKLIEIKTFYGPNVTCRSNAVVITYSLEQMHGEGFVKKDIVEKIVSLIPKELQYLFPVSELFSSDNAIDINDLLLILTKKVISIHGENGLNIFINNNEKHCYHLITEFHNEKAANISADIAFSLINFSLNLQDHQPSRLVKHIKGLFNELVKNLPGKVITNMLKVATEFNIPFYPVGSRPLHFLYGQGKKGVIYDYASNFNDSLFGVLLAKNKMSASQFIGRLGYPVTKQIIVSHFSQCQEAIKTIGFPSVLKPFDGKRGEGVSTNIKQNIEVEEAYRKAAMYSKGKVLIENFIEGENYRFTISQGKLNSVYIMKAGQVIGDGHSTIIELVKKENKNRDLAKEKGSGVKRIELNEEIKKYLAKQSISTSDIPEEGQLVTFAGTTNAATGGTYERIDFKLIHEDILEMMFDIAEAFKLDNIGIDYISCNISASWRETGTIIEVNPYISTEKTLCENVFNNHFPESTGSRIDTLLCVYDDDKFALEQYNIKMKSERDVGFVSNSDYLFRGGEMIGSDKNHYQKCLGLLLNPKCGGLIVRMSNQEIFEYGLPIDYFDKCIIGQNCDGEVLNLIKNNCGELKTHKV